jgi:lipopolysaccharide export system protein LptA
MWLKRVLLFGLTLFLVGIGFWGPQGVLGKEKAASEPEHPIITEADSLELDQKNNTATFTGDVVARQKQKGKDTLIITCQKMVIYSSGETAKKSTPSDAKGREEKKPLQNNQVEKIVATGQVKITLGKNVASGDTAVFYNNDQRIILSGKAEFWEGKSMVKGEEITVWLKEDRALVKSKGSNRVRAVIYQEEKQ